MRARQKLEDLVDAFAARALISATGAPSSLRELAQIQLAAATAQIVGHVQDDQRGQAQARIGAASIRWRARLVESRTSSTASGLGVPARLPCSTSWATCSSSERGCRL